MVKAILNYPNRNRALITVALIAIVGTFTIIYSFAASPYAVINPSNWALSGGATSTSFNGASGGKIIKFNAPSAPAPSPSPAPAPSPSPSPAPVPAPTSSCPAYPKFPDASCTGVPAGTSLKPYTGTMTINQAGTVIDGMDISGNIVIQASNVTIKNSKIHGSGYYGVQVISGNVTIQNCELYGFSEAAIGFDNWKAYNVNIHGMGSDGVKFGSNTILQDSYFHDFTTTAGAHADGGQLQFGANNITIRHNWINPLGQENSALFMAPDQGPSANGPVTIDGNLLGGGNYTLYIVDGNNGQYHESGYSVTNNRFLRNAQYGPANINEPAANFSTWSGNVYDDNNAAITL